MNYRKIREITLRGWLALATAGMLLASEHHGTVQFASLPLPGATVTLTQGDKKMTAVTDLDGVYHFADVPDGIWNLDIEMLGFQPLKQEIAIAPGAPSPKWEMKMLTLDQIKAAEPTGAAASGILTSPLPTTAAPTPATSSATSASSATTPTPSIAGAETATASNSKNKKNSKNSKNNNAQPAQQGGFQRTDVNAQSGAAAAANDASTPTMGGVAEASQSSADALVVNGSQSSGIERRVIGNNRKGPASLYRFGASYVMDNSYLDAQNFSLTGQQQAKPVFNHINATADVGGPLYIPHVLRSSGQWFLSYQLGRNRNASTNTGTVPTPQELAGNFSQVVNALGQPVTITDPTTGQPFPNAVIPANRISPQALSLLQYYPGSNFIPTAGYNFQNITTGRSDFDMVQSRFNRNLNQKNFINGYYNYQNSRSNNTNNIFGFEDVTDTVGQNANFSYRHVFSPRVNVNTGITWSRQSSITTPFFANKTNVSGQAGITGNDQDALDWGPPSLGFSGGSGISGLGDTNASTMHNQTTALKFDGFWARRPHNFTFGVDYQRQDFNRFNQSNPRGNFGFNGDASGYDFSDFLLGIPDTSSISFGNADKYFRDNRMDAFVQDDWRVGPALSLNLGLRWDYSSPIAEKYGRLVNLDVAPGYSAIQPVTGYDPVGPLTNQRYPDTLISPFRKGFEPGVSFAWRPIFGDSMVVRGGYSLRYDTTLYNQIVNLMSTQSPLSKSLQVQNSPANPLTLANGFYAPANTVTNTFGVDPNFKPGYAQNWTVSVQRDLPAGMILNLGYTGVKGTHAQQAFAPNTYPLASENPCPSCPLGYAYLISGGNSESQIGTIQIRRRLHNGIQASVLYKLQHSLDDAGLLGGRAAGTSALAQDWLDLRADRGRSSFDQRNQVQIQLQYTSGMGLKGGTLLSGWRGAALKGWTVLTNITVGSGLPITPTCGSCLIPGTVYGIRPDYIGGNIYAGQPGYFLNSDAFAPPPPGFYGDAGRGMINGPGQFVLNGSAMRSFGQLDLRLDTTNALNHVVFGSWNSNISTALFGIAQSPNAMRDVRLTLRMRF